MNIFGASKIGGWLRVVAFAAGAWVLAGGLPAGTAPKRRGQAAVDVDKVLREHNRVRAAVRVPPLVYSKELAAYAQKWADHLAAGGGTLQHRPDEGPWKGLYGENLFAGTVGYYDEADAVKSWESEKALYSGEPISRENFRGVGHYTQMVWRTTERVGCGKAVGGGMLVIVCNYDPPGNILGRKPYEPVPGAADFFSSLFSPRQYK